MNVLNLCGVDHKELHALHFQTLIWFNWRHIVSTVQFSGSSWSKRMWDNRMHSLSNCRKICLLCNRTTSSTDIEVSFSACLLCMSLCSYTPKLEATVHTWDRNGFHKVGSVFKVLLLNLFMLSSQAQPPKSNCTSSHWLSFLKRCSSVALRSKCLLEKP